MRILYLHGIGSEESKPELTWVESLNMRLSGGNTEPVTPADVVAPVYAQLWKTGEQSVPAAVGRRDNAAFWEFRQRQSSLESRVPSEADSAPASTRRLPGPRLGSLTASEWAEKVVLRTRQMEQVRDFLKYPWHSRIMREISEVIGDDPAGDWVIVAHSLGTAVALEYLTQLPRGMRVRLLLTIGSPLGRRFFEGFVKRCRDHIDYHRLDYWLNVYDTGDVIPGRLAIESAVTGAANLSMKGRVRHGPRPRETIGGKHAVNGVVYDPRVAGLMDSALFGEADWVPRRRASDVTALVGLATGQYAWRVERALLKQYDGGPVTQPARELAVRYSKARLASLADLSRKNLTVADAARAATNENAYLGPYLGSAEPADAARLAVALVLTDPIAPHQVETPSALRRQALIECAVDLGWPASFVETASGAVELAREGVGVKRGQFACGDGLGGVVDVDRLVQGLEASEAIDGVGWAAVLERMLALGPGGVAAGLVAIAGSGTVGCRDLEGLGVALTAKPHAVVAQVLVEVLAAAKTAKDLALPSGASWAEWSVVSSASEKAQETRARLAEISDAKSGVLKAAEAVSKTLDDARAWMTSQKLTPTELVMADSIEASR